MNKYIWESTKVQTAFLFMGHGFWKTVKVLESNILNGCLKISMVDLCKIGLTMRE